ncbi:MAG: ribulose bisphosphate carboxylase small subunit [Acidimicrobiales bacterium]|jgi:ribulose-bisphosphate carboxylase small chain
METNIRDYPSRLGDAASKRLGTFSYLPRFDTPAVETQIEYLVGKDLTPMIEHVEPIRATSRYWYMWKLPLFGERDPQVIWSEVEACIQANPTHHVRLIGFDPRRQTQVVAFVVSRGVPSD